MEPVAPSPCTNVCRINEVNGWCEGCRRTLDEIAEWGGATPQRQREILALLAARKR